MKKNTCGKERYEELQRQKEIREKQGDLQLRWKLEDKIGKEAATRYMKESIPEITKYGDFDDKTLIAMAQMEADGIKRDEAIAAALMSEQYLSGKDSNKLGDKAATEFEKTLSRRGTERGLNGDDFRNRAKATINKLDKYRYK